MTSTDKTPLPKILLVDDNLINIATLKFGLSELEYDLFEVYNGEDALNAVGEIQPDLILLDVLMPGINGFEVCNRLKRNEATADIPVIFLSSLDDSVDRVNGLEVGGEDYIIKPFDMNEVIARIRVHLALHEKRLQLEEIAHQDRKYMEEINQFRNEILDQLRHDVRSPLTAIQSSAYLMSRLTDADKKEKYQHNVEAAVQQVLEMIDELLEVATLATGRSTVKKPVRLMPLLQHVHNTFQPMCETKDITFSTNLEALSEDTSFLLDKRQIITVLRNLIGNAIKYTLPGGEVFVSLQVNKDHMVILVRDTGVGIPETSLPRLFDRFYRVPSQEHLFEGTGLGLYIVKVIVDGHGGDITIDSTVNVGSTFTVKLPA